MRITERIASASTIILACMVFACSCDGTATNLQSSDNLSKPTPNLTPTPIGVYRGAFRISLGDNHPKMMNRDAFLASHPERGKLFWAVSGPSMPTTALAVAGTKAYVGSFSIPDLHLLDPHHALDETPMANPVGDWTEVSEDYLANSNSGTSANYVRLGGIAFDREGNTLYLNWARHYHVQREAVPSLAAYDPVTLRRTSEFHMPSGTSGEASDPNGRLTSLAGSPLGEYGDFLSVPHWGAKMYGPRQNLLRITGSNSIRLSSLLAFPASNQWVNASQKIQCGSGVFASGKFVFPLRNGKAGWYGYQDGFFDTKQTKYVASEGSLVPDLWGTTANKSYHAPPYRAYIASIGVNELIALAEGDRTPQKVEIELHDFTEQQFRFRADEKGQRQYQSLVACSLVEQMGYFFILGAREDTSGKEDMPGPVVYVFSHDS